jgi:hypothetical protein
MQRGDYLVGFPEASLGILTGPAPSCWSEVSVGPAPSTSGSRSQVAAA